MQRTGGRPSRRSVWIPILSSIATLAVAAPAAPAQDPEEAPPERKLEVEPTQLELQVGDKAKLVARVVDGEGQVLEEEVFFFSRGRRSVTVDKEGNVEALAPGSFTIVVRTRRARRSDNDQQSRALLGERLTATVSVTILPPPLERIELAEPVEGVFAGTSSTLIVSAFDVNGGARPEAAVKLTSSDPRVASFDPFGQLLAHAPGTITAVAEAQGLRTELALNVLPNPVASLALAADADTARTGDVLHFEVTASDAAGATVTGVPVLLTFLARPDDDLGAPASGQIEPDGRFVAETPGIYTVVATCGAATARTSVRIEPRNVGGKLELVGRGEVFDTHTSDLWVWEGVDGRDYAVTGTWSANGDAHFWDVTDPTKIERIKTITVDARTVNDVKVSQNGRTCVISREGASNRKNGIVIIDVTNPREAAIVGTFDENLTGGVHNVFVDQDKVYALSAGRRYDVIDIADPTQPVAIGKFELDTPGHSIHDVWVEDGLAFSSNWGDGVQIVDVGNGIREGSPANPAQVASYAYPSGRNHAAFPYTNEETGRFYVVAGDEAFPYGLHVKDKPTYPRGWLHFIDFTDLDEPQEVARYEVPEAGSHNLWIEGDLCYAAFYNGGVRVVDISGELLGDLYRQGREIAWFIPSDAEGYIPNASMVWGPQPYKGNIFFSDWNTGLWCVKLVRKGDGR